MSQLEENSIDRPWRLWASLIVIGALAMGVLSGLVLIPVVQGAAAGIDPFTAICRAIGILPGSPAAQQPVSTAAAHPVSDVAWDTAILTRLNAGDKKLGAATAELCAACHGAQGISSDPAIPDLAGQSAFAIYKQLHDYRNGARVNETMAATVKGLSDSEMANVAVHWSSQSTGALDSRVARSDDALIVGILERGDAARGLPACNSCHSANAGGPIETPTLSGQRAEYLLAQLKAYRSGARKNDIYRRMRSVAAKLTDDEMLRLSRYYTRSR